MQGTYFQANILMYGYHNTVVKYPIKKINVFLKLGNTLD